MKLKYLNQIEQATATGRVELFRLGIAVIFLVAIMILTITSAPNVPNSVLLVTAAVIGGYMALNIGANDVANNVGPAVGSQAITIFWAIVIAMLFEASGAIIAGGDVVNTVKKGIINPELINNTDQFIWLMMAALLAASIWLNVATYVGAPVSTTHAIVGGVLGSGVAAGGFGIADWGQVGAITGSWIISPVMGGIIAASMLYIIKRTITYKKDMLSAATVMVPILTALMAWTFATYILIKGTKKIFKVEFITALLIGLLIAIVVLIFSKLKIKKKSLELENNKQSISTLFTIPLVFSAALLSFAHGANDIANAVGPLAAINDAINTATVAGQASIPLWVMAIGALGISLGLALYGPKLICVVGSEITDLDRMRAYCVAMAAAITVIIASQLGLPISSTHVAIGAVFGIGFLREVIKSNYAMIIEDIRMQHIKGGQTKEAVQVFLDKFEKASFEDKGVILRDLKKNTNSIGLSEKERKSLKKQYNKQLVKRSALYKIIIAWVVTVPISGILSAMFYFMLRGMLLK